MIGVVHLVWGPLGVEPLREFLASYRAHSAGADHELVVLANGVDVEGVDSPLTRAGLVEELEGIEHRLIVLERPVLDLVAYGEAARRLEHSRLCFLNSHSRILAPDWLGHLDRALTEPGIGLAGATGSWASLLSYGLLRVGLPSAYSNIYGDRRTAISEFAELHAQRTGESQPVRAPRRWAYTAIALAGTFVGFERFPAHHLRTNALMIDRAVLMRVVAPRLRRKVDSHRLESGRASVTRQVERLGLRAVVVDRAGRVYDHRDWPLSETFWQGTQQGLLVADNQTTDYDRAAPPRRLLLARYAWGDRAAPL
jgi:hypothetical protein